MSNPCFIKKIRPLPLIFLAAAVVLVGLVSVACGGGETDPTDTSDIKKYDRSKSTVNTENEPGDEVNQSERQGEPSDVEKAAEAGRILKKVSLSPQKIRVDSTAAIEVETAEPLKDNQYLTYVFWKNSKPLEETKEASLPPNTFKKHDILFADVKLYEDEQLLAKKRSDTYIVLNSPPEIEEVVLPEVKGPGTYKFTVKSKDADNDTLTFSMEMDKQETEGEMIPLVDAQIDASSGEVTCILDENLPDLFKFTITASDGDGGVAQKIVSMRFFKRPVKQ
ncbi:MAG: Cadherin repeat protein [Acidobacteriota bacterium]|nr:Cadherin repeat protein [Acidobacteriota bacterium]